MASKAAAPALEVFPTLRRWPVIRPRPGISVPIGRQDSTILDKKSIDHSMRHLYHDLGVLVFSGCSAKQAARIGDVLARTVGAGGPGGMKSLFDGQRGERTARGQLKAVKKSECNTIGHITVVKPGVLVEMAEKTLGGVLKDMMSMFVPKIEKARFRQTKVVIPAQPFREQTALQTATGTRPLKLNSFATFKPDARRGNIVGRVDYWAVGTGYFVGSAELTYAAYQRHDNGAMEHVKLRLDSSTSRLEVKEQETALVKEVTASVLEPLWQLEREVWADRLAILQKKGPSVLA